VTRWLTAAALVLVIRPGLIFQFAKNQTRSDFSVPRSSLTADAYAALEKRCGTPKSASPESLAVLRRSRWVPFLHLDQAIARDGIEVVGGMSAATPGCTPELFNLFVFVGGAYAGTVSPTAMTPSRDGVAGPVRIIGADTITVEFARYQPGDSECCPSSRERVSYRIEKAGAGPTLVATDTRQLR
jgi:hypothetical protein